MQCPLSFLKGNNGLTAAVTTGQKLSVEKSSNALVMDYEMQEPSWMKVARAEQGIRTFGTGNSNPRITEYHSGTNIAGYDDKASWCSSFVNWSLSQVGIQGTSSALARSWLEWGVPIDEPKIGCIVVLWRDDPDSWKGHVGFFQKAEGECIFLLGGNQLEDVRVHSYPVSTVLAYRWPSSGSLNKGCA